MTDDNLQEHDASPIETKINQPTTTKKNATPATPTTVITTTTTTTTMLPTTYITTTITASNTTTPRTRIVAGSSTLEPEYFNSSNSVVTLTPTPDGSKCYLLINFDN